MNYTHISELRSHISTSTILPLLTHHLWEIELDKKTYCLTARAPIMFWTKKVFTVTGCWHALSENLFPLIFQLYFIKDIGNLVPCWKELENLPKESAIPAYFTHCSCFFHFSQTCYQHLFLSELIIVECQVQQRERWDRDFTDCGRCTQTGTKRR